MLFQLIDPFLMRRGWDDEWFDLCTQFLQFLVDLLNTLVGNITIDLFLARGGTPQDFFPLMGHEERQAFNQTRRLIHEGHFALKGFEGRQIGFEATFGFVQNDRLQRTTHTVTVPPWTNQQGQLFQPTRHDNDR